MELIDLYSNCYKNPLNGSNYCLVSIKNENKDCIIGVFSSWSGFPDENDEKYEIRQIDIILPENVQRDFVLLNKDLLVINNPEELTSFLKIGGYAIIEKGILEKHLKEITEPIICSNSIDRGFIRYDSLPKINQARFARDKFRAEIIDRDNYQCRICGSSPDDSVHIRLEVHHIKPWEEGGLTLKENLITLCNSCHLGAKQYNRWKLYQKIGISHYYQNNTFFAPQKNYTTQQHKKSLYLASNTIEIIAKHTAIVI